MSRKDVLVCTLGRSPQVLVETVWALANQEQPIIPDKIVAISMANYATEARRSIFCHGGGWQLLLSNLRKAKIRFLGKLDFADISVAADSQGEIDDLKSVEDNARCANYLFRLVREFTDGSCPVRLIFSLSGGRKSLSAIVTSTMSLLARPDDMLIHLIADEELEKDQKYHFPPGAVGYSLFQVPFIRTRGLLKRFDINQVNTFDECLRLTQGQVPCQEEFPELTVDMRTGTLKDDRGNVAENVDPTRLILLWLIFREKQLARDTFSRIIDAALKVARSGDSGPAWMRNLARKKTIIDFRQLLQATKSKVLLRQLKLSPLFCRALIPDGNRIQSVFEIDYPHNKLVVNETDYSRELYAKLQGMI